jgi:hypothetical protein
VKDSVTVLSTLHRRARAARVTIAAVVVADCLAVGSGIPYSRYLRSLPPDTVIAAADAVPVEVAYALIAVLQTVAFVAAAVCFIRWFYHVYSNVPGITGRPTSHSPKWAGWGFVVPFLNVIRPQQIMRETWDAMLERWLREREDAAGPVPADRVTLWWTLFVAASVLNYFAGRLTWYATTAIETAQAALLTMAADGLDGIAGAATLVVVANVTRLQGLLLARRGSAATVS